MRLVLSSIVLATLVVNPCFAKGGHAQHGAHASTTNSGASGKGTSGANPAPVNANVPIDANATVAPPVLPPHAATQQQIRIINPSGKTAANPVNRVTMSATTTPIARNAIGQAVVLPKNFTSAQLPMLALQKPVAVSPRTSHVGPAALPVSSDATRMSVANAMNRSNLNGATVIRPATGSVGGPAQARYGISGTTVQSKH